jgi:hypothetical protein
MRRPRRNLTRRKASPELQRPQPQPQPHATNSSEPECPICYGEFEQGAHTDRARSAFPCGHSICRACDVRMAEVNDHRCPTCRTPRQGISAEAADLAAQTEALRDTAMDSRVGVGVGTGMATVIRRDGRDYQVIFFRSETVGPSPTALLDRIVQGARRVEVGPSTITLHRTTSTPAPTEAEAEAEAFPQLPAVWPATIGGLLNEFLLPAGSARSLVRRRALRRP